MHAKGLVISLSVKLKDPGSLGSEGQGERKKEKGAAKAAP
jgi:hypothetical protein